MEGRYQVLKPFRASVDGEEIPLEPGEIIPGDRVPEVESWGRSIDHLLNTHFITAVVPHAVGTAMSAKDLVAALMARKPGEVVKQAEALLDHLETLIPAGAVLARFEDSHLVDELRRRGVLPAAADEDAAEGSPAGAGNGQDSGGTQPDGAGEPAAATTAKKSTQRKPAAAKSPAKKSTAKAAAKKPAAKA